MDKEVTKRQEDHEAPASSEQEGLFEQVVQKPANQEPSEPIGMEELHAEHKANTIPFEVADPKNKDQKISSALGIRKGEKLTTKESVEALRKLIAGGTTVEPTDLVNSLNEIQDQTEQDQPT